MEQINIHKAKSNFSNLINRAIAGEEIIIAKSGRPVIRLMPINPPPKKRILGQDKGLYTVPEDFDEFIPPGFLQSFDGEEDADID